MVNRRAFRMVSPLFLMTMFLGYAQEIDVQGLASKLAPAIANSGKATVAVVDFVDLDGNRTQFGRYLAEELAVALVGPGNHIEVVDRAHVQTILAEHKLAEKGLIDPATVRQAASLVGADLLVTGTVTPLGGTVHIAAKVLSAETGRIVGAASSDLPRTKAVDDMLAAAGAGDSSAQPAQQGAEPSARMQVSSSGQSGQGALGSVTGRFGIGGTRPSMNVGNFEFDVRSCSLQRGTVICSLQIKNVGQDNWLYVCFGSCFENHSPRLVDDRGNEYVATGVQLGSTVGTIGWNVRASFTSNVPMGASMRFENVSPDVSSVALLEFLFDDTASNSAGGPPGKFRAQLRNIPLKK